MNGSVSDYKSIVDDLKKKIKQSRTQTILHVNHELLNLYWQIGKVILTQQELQGWGTKVIDQLANDLCMAFPDLRGLSSRNLKYMRAFAEAYPDFSIVQVPLAQLTWYHHITLLDKVKDPEIRQFYIIETSKNGWSRNMMVEFKVDLLFYHTRL